MENLSQIKTWLNKLKCTDACKNSILGMIAHEMFQEEIISNLSEKTALELSSHFRISSNTVFSDNINLLLTRVYNKIREENSGAVVLKRVYMPSDTYKKLLNEYNLPEECKEIRFHGASIVSYSGEWIIAFGERKFYSIPLQNCLMFGQVV